MAITLPLTAVAANSAVPFDGASVAVSVEFPQPAEGLTNTYLWLTRRVFPLATIDFPNWLSPIASDAVSLPSCMMVKEFSCALASAIRLQATRMASRNFFIGILRARQAGTGVPACEIGRRRKGIRRTSATGPVV